MARFYIIGGILAVAMAVYAIVDLTITDDRRIRRLNRVLWAVLIVLVPIVGPLGWLFWGKGPRSFAPPQGPEDSKEFRTQMAKFWVGHAAKLSKDVDGPTAGLADVAFESELTGPDEGDAQ